MYSYINPFYFTLFTSKKPSINKKGTLLNWFTVSPKKDTANGTADMSSSANTDQEPVSKKPKLEDSQE